MPKQWVALLAIALTGCDGLTCWETTTEGGIQHQSYVGDRRCYRLSSPRKMTGLWVKEMENYAFFEGVSDPAHIDIEEGAELNPFELLEGRELNLKGGRIYKVELIGSTPLPSFASLVLPGIPSDLYDELVVVDEFVRIEDIGPSRPDS